MTCVYSSWTSVQWIQQSQWSTSSRKGVPFGGRNVRVSGLYTARTTFNRPKCLIRHYVVFTQWYRLADGQTVRGCVRCPSLCLGNVRRMFNIPNPTLDPDFMKCSHNGTVRHTIRRIFCRTVRQTYRRVNTSSDRLTDSRPTCLLKIAVKRIG